ncbi:uncharacterized protein LOC141601883 [Silene latifolia]|uniref:uncharacterized protein LOC141601883 n=1 Tax=Silene latifolia TaxID=37657 RepID=UPI003D777328
MEILSRYLRQICSLPQVTYHPKCARIKLNHLIFADDLMIFVRGDVPSVTAVAHALDKFGSISGLVANPDKTEIYFGGVHNDVKALITQATGYSEGNYLWQSSVDHQKIYMKSWAMCCSPWDEGGFNIKEVLSWNNANLCKGIWNLLHSSDSLWAQWHKTYAVKQGTIWTATVKPAHSKVGEVSCISGSLLEKFGTAVFFERALAKTCVSKNGKFVVHKAYDLIRNHYPKLRWAHVIWHPSVLPKHSFIATLAGQHKLPTVNSLCRRGLYLTNWCVLCKHAMETHSHLFFYCAFAGDLWRKVLAWMGLNGRTSNLRRELHWCSLRQHRRHWKAGWYRCCLSACIYTVWQERNARIFAGHETDVAILLKQLQFTVKVRILNRHTKDSRMVTTHLSSIYA